MLKLKETSKASDNIRKINKDTQRNIEKISKKKEILHSALLFTKNLSQVSDEVYQFVSVCRNDPVNVINNLLEEEPSYINSPQLEPFSNISNIENLEQRVKQQRVRS